MDTKTMCEKYGLLVELKQVLEDTIDLTEISLEKLEKTLHLSSGRL